MARDVDRLIDAIPIESYISRFVSLKKKGANFWGLCPFHNEKTPSFSVAPEKGIFKCFGCGKGGNVISFVQEYDRVQFIDALKILSEYAGIPLEGGRSDNKARTHKEDLFALNEWVRSLYISKLKNPETIDYLKQRSVSEAAIDHFKIGYAPPEYRFLESHIPQKDAEKAKKTLKLLKELGLVVEADNSYNRFRDRLMFPIHDVRGRCIGFGGRILQNRDNVAKYMNSPDSTVFRKKNNLYHLYEAREEIRKMGQAILVEGYFDVLGLYMKDIANAVAPLGTAFTEEQARLLKRYTDRVVVFFDTDNAGIDAALKSVQIARRYQIEPAVVIPDGNIDQKKDPFDLAAELDPIDLISLLDNARSELQFVLWYFFTHKFSIENMAQKRQAIQGFFSYVAEFEQNWEKLDYIDKAAELLETDNRVLRKDFGSFAKTGNVATAQATVQKNVTEKMAEITNHEKQVIALLLRFPEFWHKKKLLEEMPWPSEDGYLLFTFFRDRLIAGEVFNWQNLSPVMNILPANLSSLLSGIIIETEPVFEPASKTSSAFTNENKHYERMLERLVLQTRLKQVENDYNRYHRRLRQKEKLGEPVDEEEEMLGNLIKEKDKLKTYLSQKKK